MSLAEVGASVFELLEVGGLDGIELGSIETAWLGGLWKTTARGVTTARTIVITKPASLTDGFFNFLFVTGSSLLVCRADRGWGNHHIPHW